MSRSRRDPTFAEVVAEVRATPPAPEPGPVHEGFVGDAFVDRELRRYDLVADDISPARAAEVAAAGAQLAWDPCGCGGGCGYLWADEEELRTAAADGRGPHFQNRRREGMSEWRSEDGRRLLLVTVDFSWGGLQPHR